jgi:NADH-quinone oxidoreductase subunit L
MAFAQKDIKKVLAYSTVSQLGFMFAAVGVGAYVAGIFHLVTHAVFKAGLFLGAGSVMHAMSGSGDITRMGGLKNKIPRTHRTFQIFCLAIAGIPPFAGFFSKDEVLAGVAGAHFPPGFIANYGSILWAILTVTALCTAFYMWRLYYLVFSGECRADEETKHHIHESPSSMTVPLIVLAVLTCTVGFLGMPLLLSHLLHIPNAMAAWLNPILVPSEGPHLSSATEAILMAIALVAAVCGIFLARTLYRHGPSLWVRKMTSYGIGHSVYEVVFNKYYVDELYDSAILKPFRYVAQKLYQVVDRFLIDLVFVDGSARVVDVFGRVVRWFQNGQVQRYLVAILVGAALLFFAASKPTLKIHHTPVESGAVRFTADLGGGAGTDKAAVEWDFNGDGQTDSTEREALWNFPAPGSYDVVLRSHNPVFGRDLTVTETVVLSPDQFPRSLAPEPEPAPAPEEQP